MRGLVCIIRPQHVLSKKEINTRYVKKKFLFTNKLYDDKRADSMREYALMNTKEICTQTSAIEMPDCQSFTCLVVNVLWCIYTHKLKLPHPHDTSAYASPENFIINSITIQARS